MVGGPAKSNKQVNKTDAANTEAAQLLQLFDDGASVLQVTEAKINTVSQKLNARLTPEIIGQCLTDNPDDRSISVVSTARVLRGKLQACIPLITALAATSGDQFHFETLSKALKGCRKEGVTVATHVDDILAVRELTMVAEQFEFSELLSKLESGLGNLKEESREEITQRTLIHTVESLMRMTLPTDEKASSLTGKERCLKIAEFVGLLKNSTLWKRDSLQELTSQLLELETLCSFVQNSEEVIQESATRAEKARTMLNQKASKFLKCTTAFPLGIWMMESVQDCLASFHLSMTWVSGLKVATLVCTAYG